MATVLPFLADSAPRESTRPRKSVRLQITRRGRIVLASLAFVAGIAVALAAILLFGVPSASAGGDESAPTVTVASGDTLWEYADRYAAPGTDDQDFVRETRALNGLSSPRLTEGQQIVLPAGSTWNG